MINLDFADVQAVMKDAGPALIGLGRGAGRTALRGRSPGRLEPPARGSVRGARGILFNVSGPADLRLGEVREAAEEIRKHADSEANIIFGASFSESLGNDVLVTLIATGLNGHELDEHPEVKAPRKRPGRAAKVVAPAREEAAAAVAVATSADVASDVSPGSPNLDEDALEVPSFLRRGGRVSASESTPRPKGQA